MSKPVFRQMPRIKTFVAECVDDPLAGKLRRASEGTVALSIPDGRGGIAYAYSLEKVGGLTPDKRIWKLIK